MNKVFTDNGWADYVYWQTEDRKTLKTGDVGTRGPCQSIRL